MNTQTNKETITRVMAAAAAGDMRPIAEAMHADYVFRPMAASRRGVWADAYAGKQHVIQKVFALSPEDSLEKAVELMAQKKLGCMPVVDANKRVVGITTVTDILLLFLKSLREKK